MNSKYRCAVIWLYLYNLDKFRYFFNELSNFFDITIYYENEGVDKSKYPKIKFVKVPKAKYGRFIGGVERIVYYHNEIKDNADFILIFSKGYHEIISFLLKQFLDIPVIMRLRGNHLHEYEKREASFIKKWFVRKGLRFIWQSFDVIIPISNKLRNHYLYEHKCKNLSYSVYNGIKSRLFYREPLKNEYPVFGYVGRLKPEKNPKLLLQVFKECKNINFIVASRNEGEYVFPNNVEYVGFVDRDKLSEKVYNRCDYILLPSTYETQSMVTLESYLTDTPIIVNRYALPYDIPIQGFTLDDNSKEWINLIQHIHKDKLFLGCNMRNYIIYNFNWINSVKEITNIIHNYLYKINKK